MEHANKTTENRLQASNASLNEVRHGKNGTTLEDNRTNFVVQRKANNTGLPDGLKSGIENLSGYSMDDVKVHYNSSAPAQVNAHAYAQGTSIHIAPGQEKHLPHEAWHVVQQKEGRVKPTMQLKKVNVNDSEDLEREADRMGSLALQKSGAPAHEDKPVQRAISTAVIQRLTAAQRQTINQRIAVNQGIANAQKPTIEAGRHGGWNLVPGMRRNALDTLIQALNTSIPARQQVLSDQALLGQPDHNGGHAARIVNEQNLRTLAQNDRATINRIAAGAWAAVPGQPGREQRNAARWARDPVRVEYRNVVAPADAAAGWHAVQGRRH